MNCIPSSQIPSLFTFRFLKLNFRNYSKLLIEWIWSLKYGILLHRENIVSFQFGCRIMDECEWVTTKKILKLRSNLIAWQQTLLNTFHGRNILDQSKIRKWSGFSIKWPRKFVKFDAIFLGYFRADFHKRSVISKLRSSTADFSRPKGISPDEPQRRAWGSLVCS